MNGVRRADTAVAIAALGAGALVVATLIPFADEPVVFPALDLGVLLAATGLGGLALAVAVTAAATGERRAIPARLESAALWAACGLAALSSLAAVAATAETLNLTLIVAAQLNTSLYVLKQPAAASVYLAALALAGQPPALRAVLGPPSLPRAVSEATLVMVLGALGATLFLGGFGGEGLPGPVWLLAKTVVVALTLVAMRRRLAGLAHGPRLAIAWAAALVGLINLAVTLVLATR
jgi:NADH:ubiquinone oxidoreductase subunit H